MTYPVQITFKGFDTSEAVENRVRERAARLERHHRSITDCRVVLEAPHRHHRKGRIYTVRIDLVVPGGELVVTHDAHDKHAHEDINVAIRDAFLAMERKLADFARKRGGEVKAHETPPHGRVTRVFPDYGFIEDPDGNEIYFHMNSVVEGSFEQLQPGDEVRFVAVEQESDKGPQATTVRPVGKHHLT